MNLLHMNYFIAVVEHQSISRAAQSLFITQQTLSSHIASMEKEGREVLSILCAVS